MEKQITSQTERRKPVMNEVMVCCLKALLNEKMGRLGDRKPELYVIQGERKS